MSSEHQPFVHLHVHSEYSLLDGLSRIKDLVKRAVELNQPALALTDHGAMYGAIEFYRAARAAGIKPIIGIETYLARRGMSQKDPNQDRDRYHMLLLATDPTGYQNLLAVASTAQLEGYYYKPRIDRAFMAQHSQGIVATTGCMAGEIPRAISDRNMKRAHRLMAEYVDIFGVDRFFVELQEHSIPELKRINKALLEMAPRYGLEGNFLATNDVHYTLADDADPHDVLLCVQTSSTLQQTNRLRFSDKGYYLKSHAEMNQLFGQVPGALTNSLRIAEMCDVALDYEGYRLPDFTVPSEHTPSTYLAELCERGLIWRYGARAQEDAVLRARLQRELQIIDRMGFATYFLIVWDLCQWAARSDAWWESHQDPFPYDSYVDWQENDIWWNVRGSGAASVVAYTLGITSIEPLANGLIFERFLNPGRISMPDIDLDYPDDMRHLMVAYAMRRYGKERVAQIITFGTLGARAAVRDVGRALDLPLADVDRVARLIPAIPGKPVKLENVLDPDHEFFTAEFDAAYKADGKIRQLVDTAQKLEGIARHASSHAAGVIISDRPLVELVPLNRPTSGDEGLGGVDRVTQWPMEIVESIGLLKVDFLGLSTLTVMRRAARLIEDRHGVVYTMDNIPYDEGHVGPDPSKRPEALFDMLGRGEVAGVFQVEGAGMRKLMIEMRPRQFAHIVAAISLYRPGPMENIPEYIRRMHAAIYDGKNIVRYHTPELEPILKDTYGILVYQEQIIQIASDLAGYEPGEADMIRKAVGKKKKELIDQHRLQFTEGAMARGFSADVCDAIWSDIEFFARYGFNRAHAADYAKVTCQTAFLKAHYPVEYLTAMLSVERDNSDKVRRYVAEAKSLGIEVAPPDINFSALDFTIDDQPERSIIRFGMGAVKNAGEGAINLILAERAANGPFASVQDLCDRVDLRRVGKRAVEFLSKGRAFDRWGASAQFVEALDRIIADSGRTHDAAAAGQMTLFGGAFGESLRLEASLLHSLESIPQVEHKTTLEWEKEALGVHVSEHPLERPLAQLEPHTNATLSDLDESWHGKVAKVAGVITSLRTLTTRKGDPMAFGQLGDLDGEMEVVFFPRTWKQVRDQVQVDQVMIVRGKVQVEETRTKILVDLVQTSLELAHAAEASGTGGHYLDYPSPVDASAMPDEPSEDNGDADERPLETDSPRAPAEARPEPARGAEVSDPFADDFALLFPPDARQAGSSTAENHARERSSRPQQGTPPSAGNGQTPEPANGTASSAPPKLIRVEIDPHGDWRETCRQSLELASAYDGNDRFSLAIAGVAGFTMDFPNQRTGACAALLDALRRLPGVTQVPDPLPLPG